MSFENPTPLRAGVTGTLDGRRLRVAGRVVVGMQADDGETYYWNEFNLVDGFGRNATLVFEETEDGPEWKLFKYIEPLRAMSVSEAAAKRVGDTVNIDGTPTKITLVDQSRVYHIEGAAPDGVELGDVANYFNADQGERMLVVSWTGDEIEFFEGHDLSGREVAAAFGFAGGAFEAMAALSGATVGARPSGSRMAPLFVGAAFLAVTLFSLVSCGLCSRPIVRRASSASPPPKQAAAALRLANGATGTLGSHRYTLVNHAVMEIARVGSRFDRHEYWLTGDTNEPALLINGLTGSAKEWHLLLPATPPAGLDPYSAAAKRRGTPIPVEGPPVTISEIFQSKVLARDGPDTTQSWPAVQYGFVARGHERWIVARWTESAIQFHQGKSLSEAEVLAAFGPGPEKAK